jgi:hypothetical protein
LNLCISEEPPPPPPTPHRYIYTSTIHIIYQRSYNIYIYIYIYTSIELYQCCASLRAKNIACKNLASDKRAIFSWDSKPPFMLQKSSSAGKQEMFDVLLSLPSSSASTFSMRASRPASCGPEDGSSAVLKTVALRS